MRRPPCRMAVCGSGASEVVSQEDPEAGGLPGEVITYTRDRLGAPVKTSGVDLYVADNVYTDFGQPSHVRLGDSTNEVQAIYAYDEHTLRLTGRSIHRSKGIGPLIDETRYTYDDAGNPLSAVNKQSETGNTVTDAQCYRYDGLARLVNAWTAAGDCPGASTTQPTAGGVSNTVGSYWQTYSYSAIGDREQLVEHSANGGADITTTYTNGTSSGGQPHTLTETKGGGDPTKFVYDVAGNLLSRTAASGNNQTLTWDAEGRLAHVTTTGANAGTTKYLYDADGNQLIRRDPGRTSLFVGDSEIVVNTGVSPAVVLGAVRNYSHGGAGVVAIRSTLPGGGTSYLFNDRHGTASLSIDTSTQLVSRKQYKPYGEDRANANPTAWPDFTRGYLHAPKDAATGYTDLGARKYDPVLGRFISADPLLQPANLNELGGYTYAGDNPITLSDPSGLAGDTGDGSGNGVRFNPDTGAVIGGGTGNVYDGTDKATNPGGNNNGGGNDDKQVNLSDQPVDVPEALKQVLPDYQYQYKDYTVGKLAEFASKSNDNWYLLCAHMASDSTECLGSNPFARKRSRTESLLITAAIVGAIIVPLVCTVAAAGCVSAAMAIADGEAAAIMYGGGSVLGAGGAVTGAAAGSKLLSAACSFSGNTKVLLPDGTTKAIEDVEAGDEVLAADAEDGEQGARAVQKLWVHDDDLYVLTIDGNRLVTTEDHPFWNVTDRRWEGAEELDRGDLVRTPTGTARVDGFDISDHRYASAYNLTVADLHTYYVLAGNVPVLVHNVGCGPSSYFRGARGGAPSFVPRPNDYKVDPTTGFVKETHGVSLFDNADSISSKGFEPHGLDMDSVPGTLRIIQRGRDLNHYEIVPAPGANLTPERYTEELSKIKCMCGGGG
ncbi:polymorphic toxin-type HINT domain-containing protein [Actinoplanes sp. NPDC051861]|uniref:polymorphic toxin-type HINT domain-containing protein n=1 Tax=Actinoplanes sp. NPDC051861 TaxID=3155170 RepID=UPI0034274AF5